MYTLYNTTHETLQADKHIPIEVRNTYVSIRTLLSNHAPIRTL